MQRCPQCRRMSRHRAIGAETIENEPFESVARQRWTTRFLPRLDEALEQPLDVGIAQHLERKNQKSGRLERRLAMITHLKGPNSLCTPSIHQQRQAQ